MPQANLTDDKGKLTSLAKKVFEAIYSQQYSIDGKMDKQHCLQFVSNCTSDQSACSIEDTRISGYFDKYDQEKKGYTLLNDFLDFYEKASLERPNVVWQNLKNHRFPLFYL